MPLFGFNPKPALMTKLQEYSLSYPDGKASDFDSNTKKNCTAEEGDG